MASTVQQMRDDNRRKQDFHTGQQERMLRIREVCYRTGLSRSKVYDLIAKGRFPSPIKLGERVSMWPDSLVTGWVENLVESRPEVSA